MGLMQAFLLRAALVGAASGLLTGTVIAATVGEYARDGWRVAGVTAWGTSGGIIVVLQKDKEVMVCSGSVINYESGPDLDLKNCRNSK